MLRQHITLSLLTLGSSAIVPYGTSTALSQAGLPTGTCGSTQDCLLTEYCDTYEGGKCKPCEVHCRENIKACRADCSAYLQSQYLAQLVKSDLHTLTVLVAATVAITSVALLSLLYLVAGKFNKRRRLRKCVLPTSVFSVTKDKCNIKTSPNNGQQSCMEIAKTPTITRHQNNSGSDSQHSSQSRDQADQQAAIRVVGMPGPPGTLSGPDVSVYTMSTQLSSPTILAPNNLATGAPPGNFTPHYLPSRERSSRRMPSEDCVLEGRCNMGLDGYDDSQRTPRSTYQQERL